MRKSLLLAFLVASIAAPLAHASEVEITGFAGYTFPFYSQTFTYDPGPISIDIPGVSVQQAGQFQLKGSGGLALAGSLTAFPAEGLGLELRLDSAGIKAKTSEAGFDVTATMPAPLAPVNASLTLDPAEADIDTLRPLSLNLKLRTPGPTRLYVSGGISRIGRPKFSLRQQVGLGVTLVDLVANNLDIGTVHVQTVNAEEGHSWGANAGVGIQIPLGERGGLLLEGRGFYFPRQRLLWEGDIDTPLGQVSQQLLDRLLQRIDPLEFEPWWVQATVGVSYRF